MDKKQNKVYLWITKNKYEILYWFCISILIFFMAFRDVTVGTDTGTYKVIYDGFVVGRSSIINDTIEIGFSLYCFLLAKLGFNFLGFQIINAIIINVSFGLFIKKFSKNTFLSLFFYVTTCVYFGGFNTLRQKLALCICLLGIFFILKNKKLWWTYLICIAMASTFHLSSLIFIPVLILFYVKLEWKSALIIFGIATIFMLLCKPICMFLANNLSIKYLDKYINTDYFNNNVSLKSLLLTLVYMIGLIGVFVYEKLSNIKIESNWLKCFLVLYVLCRYCSLFGCFSLMIMRLAGYFTLSIVFLIPEIIALTKNIRLKNLIKYGSMTIFLILMILQIVVMKNMDIIPYKFVF